MPRNNQNAIGLMRAITDHATSDSSNYALGRVKVIGVEWERDPTTTRQRAIVAMSDGTWLAVTVEQSEGDPR